MTGAPARSASSHHAHDRVGVRLAERAAGEALVLRVAEHRPAGDRAAGADDAVARRASARDSRRGSTGRADHVQRARGRRAPRAARARRACAAPRRARPLERHASASALTAASRQSTALCPPKPNAFEMPDRAAVAVRQRPRLARHVVEVEPLVGLLVVERRRGDPVAQRQQRGDRLDRAGGAEQVADRRLRRADRDLRRALLAERRLQRARSRRGRSAAWRCRARSRRRRPSGVDARVLQRQLDRPRGAAAARARGRSGGRRRRSTA